MKIKHNFFINRENNLIEFNTKYKYQKVEDYWEIIKKECEKNLSKFC